MTDKDDSRKTMFHRAAEELARQRGVSTEELLASYAAAIRSSKVPGPDCFDPDLCQRVVLGEHIPEKLLRHLKDCSACAGLVEFYKTLQENSANST